MADEHEVRMAQMPPDAVIDEEGITVALVRADPEGGEISVMWLPDIFSRPLPSAVRQRIVEKLRFHADKLESGELEQMMQRFTTVNNPHNRSQREQ